MRNHLCWEPGAVRRVINPFAEHIADSLFRAVHSDWDLQVAPPLGQRFQEIDAAAWIQMSPAAFLEDFLRDDRPHALAAVLGETGSGKSHLVHWMRMHIREDARRMVLVVRKSGTSLRAIVRDIIEKLPPEEQRSFLDTFSAAGDGATTPGARRRELLHHLGQAIREDSPSSRSDELEEALIDVLPNLFQDPYMQEEHFLRDGKVAAEIVDHIFEQSHAHDRPDRRRIFTVDDLTLGGRDFVHATKLAQHAIQVMDADPENRLAAVAVINRNLDKAVARTLSFSGDRVEELMTRLRTHLRSQGRELVLLVEEFARLQGIDRALLQAITTQGAPSTSSEGLCRMRTAIAVTPGFFESVADTAYRRTTHIVDMNRSAGYTDGSSPTPASVASFASRYLNAVRLGVEAIERWSESAAPGETAPSRCSSCSYAIDCHATFGEVDGYGMYPFTERSLWIGAKRVDRSDSKRMNPRTIQNDLLVEVLDTFGPDIAAGVFPSEQLLRKLGGVKELPLEAETALNARNPQQAKRWMAMLELYDATGKIVALPQPLLDTLSIPAIPDAEAPVALPAAVPVAHTDVPLSRQSLSQDEGHIQSWVRGGLLDAAVAQKLREPIFQAVAEAIDWDSLGLERSFFSGNGKAFQQRLSITFVRPTTQPGRAQIRLEVDADPKTGQALQGLLRAMRDGLQWRFEGADRAFACFLDCVERWAEDVVEQLRALTVPHESWNPANAALQLLAVGAALSGRIKTDATLGDIVDAAFSTWTDDPAASAPELRSLYAKLLRKRSELVAIAQSQISSPKGGRVGAMLDPLKVIGPLRQLRKSKWRLFLAAPEQDAGLPAQLYREIALLLPAAVAAERSQRLAWLEVMDAAFGRGATRSSIVAALSAALSTALEGGIGSQNSARPLQGALEAFQSVQYDATVKAARALANEEDALASLPDYGRGYTNAVAAANALRMAATTFLDAVEQNLRSFAEDSAGTGDVARHIQELTEALDSIVADLTTLEGSHVA
jgi:hypothetical protein